MLHSIWPRKVDPKMPYIETVHGDGTPYMQPLTVYAPPGGTVVSSVMPGLSLLSSYTVPNILLNPT